MKPYLLRVRLNQLHTPSNLINAEYPLADKWLGEAQHRFGNVLNYKEVSCD